MRKERDFAAREMEQVGHTPDNSQDEGQEALQREQRVQGVLILIGPLEVILLLGVHESAAGGFPMRPVQRTRRLPLSDEHPQPAGLKSRR